MEYIEIRRRIYGFMQAIRRRGADCCDPTIDLPDVIKVLRIGFSLLVAVARTADKAQDEGYEDFRANDSGGVPGEAVGDSSDVRMAQEIGDPPRAASALATNVHRVG
jgi:hypothetical protein